MSLRSALFIGDPVKKEREKEGGGRGSGMDETGRKNGGSKRVRKIKQHKKENLK